MRKRWLIGGGIAIIVAVTAITVGFACQKQRRPG